MLLLHCILANIILCSVQSYTKNSMCFVFLSLYPKPEILRSFLKSGTGLHGLDTKRLSDFPARSRIFPVRPSIGCVLDHSRNTCIKNCALSVFIHILIPGTVQFCIGRRYFIESCNKVSLYNKIYKYICIYVYAYIYVYICIYTM